MVGETSDPNEVGEIDSNGQLRVLMTADFSGGRIRVHVKNCKNEDRI